MDAEYYQTLADQELDRSFRTDDSAVISEHMNRAQIRAFLALASFVQAV